MIWTLIFACLAAVSAFNWIKWKASTYALIYYMEKKQCERPDENEMRKCLHFVIENALKDLTDRSKRR